MSAGVIVKNDDNDDDDTRYPEGVADGAEHVAQQAALHQ
jgi:hypothetical protein